MQSAHSSITQRVREYLAHKNREVDVSVSSADCGGFHVIEALHSLHSTLWRWHPTDYTPACEQQIVMS